jgi:hypothetical protein
LIYAVMAFGAIVATTVYAGVKYRPALWRWLAAAEALLILWSLANFRVPGTWKQFWESEIPLVVLLIAAAVSSAKLQRREEPSRPWYAMPQTLALWIVLCIIVALLITH